uniref:Uncharacterized protein n=1 Tax=Caenorhabditis tropicalis TaxID=1561998 RepID=A0A1I7T200_9PELO
MASSSSSEQTIKKSNEFLNEKRMAVLHEKYRLVKDKIRLQPSYDQSDPEVQRRLREYRRFLVEIHNVITMRDSIPYSKENKKKNLAAFYAVRENEQKLIRSVAPRPKENESLFQRFLNIFKRN